MHDDPIRDLDFEAVRAGLADGSILVVDVREDYELPGGMIPGSISLPLSRFRPELLPEAEARLVFSCAAGVRSRRVLEVLRELGHSHREHYVGGFKGWVAAGGPVDFPPET